MPSMLCAALAILVLTLSDLVHGITECKQIDLCTCKFDDGTMMDITSLGNSDNTPRFKDVEDSSGEHNYYSYNPCLGFKERACKDAAVCISNPAKSESIQIGDASKAQFKYDTGSGNVVAAYTSGSIGRLLLSEIILVCDKSAKDPTFTAQGQMQGGFFQMTLTTVCACPDGCDNMGPKHGGGGGGIGGAGGLSVGSLISIIFFVVVVMYVTLGTVVMKFVRKKEGIEIIPNVLFWRALPVLIKNGVFFTLGLCIPRFRQGGYESK